MLKGFKFSEESKKKMSESHKGQIPWNKGIKGSISNEAREKISLALKGRIPWNKGKKCEYVTERNIKNNPMKNKNVVIKSMKNRLKNWENAKIKMSASKQGIPVEEWNGFTQKYLKRLRASAEWKKWRESIFTRDNFTCQNKGCKYCNNRIGTELHPHHIKQLASNQDLAFNVDNGITYCADFHLKSGLHTTWMGVS